VSTGSIVGLVRLNRKMATTPDWAKSAPRETIRRIGALSVTQALGQGRPREGRCQKIRKIYLKTWTLELMVAPHVDTNVASSLPMRKIICVVSPPR
jgi:hypothetical protein